MFTLDLKSLRISWLLLTCQSPLSIIDPYLSIILDSVYFSFDYFFLCYEDDGYMLSPLLIDLSWELEVFKLLLIFIDLLFCFKTSFFLMCPRKKWLGYLFLSKLCDSFIGDKSLEEGSVATLREGKLFLDFKIDEITCSIN